MSRTAVARDLIPVQAKTLKMPGLGRAFEALARQAREEHWAYEDYLHDVLAAEESSRRESAVRQRLHDARFPELKSLDTFDFAATEGALSPTAVAELARGEWIGRAENVILAGPIGTGKTHLAIAFGVEAAKQRRPCPLRARRRSRPLAPRGARLARAHAASPPIPLRRSADPRRASRSAARRRGALRMCRRLRRLAPR